MGIGWHKPALKARDQPSRCFLLQLGALSELRDPKIHLTQAAANRAEGLCLEQGHQHVFLGPQSLESLLIEHQQTTGGAGANGRLPDTCLAEERHIPYQLTGPHRRYDRRWVPHDHIQQSGDHNHQRGVDLALHREDLVLTHVIRNQRQL